MDIERPVFYHGVKVAPGRNEPDRRVSFRSPYLDTAPRGHGLIPWCQGGSSKETTGPSTNPEDSPRGLRPSSSGGIRHRHEHQRRRRHRYPEAPHGRPSQATGHGPRRGQSGKGSTRTIYRRASESIWQRAEAFEAESVGRSQRGSHRSHSDRFQR